MSTNRIYRVLARTSRLHFIDIAGANEHIACARAEKLWDNGMRQRFTDVKEAPLATFEIDELASMHLSDTLNESRAEWAQKALRVFSAETGSGTEAEGLSDLICDLGHYADEHGIEFLEVAARAIGGWALEQKQPDSTAAPPSVTITIGRQQQEEGDKT